MTKKNYQFYISMFCIFSLCFTGYSQANSADANLTVDSKLISKIWDKADHNSFPDLIRFNNEFYCALREASDHVSSKNDGKVRILKSSDGKKWESVALFKSDTMDIREGRLSITPSGKIMVTLAAGVYKNGKFDFLNPMVSFSDIKGTNFSPLTKAIVDSSISYPVEWIWRVTWLNGVGYGITYQVKEEGWEAYLLKTKDGISYQNVSKLELDGNPSEATIRFDQNDKMFILVRRDAGDKMGFLVKSNPPYNDLEYTKLNIRLGGPDFLFLNDTTLVVGTRRYAPKNATTVISDMDLNGKILNTITLPSGGDTSYPGMLLFEKKLWVVYYSSHEKKSNIYLAQIPLADLPK
tara:strand:- start:8266 stop:9318 length:1053 start_codon:yes stop_codon:yes gene_type:complete